MEGCQHFPGRSKIPFLGYCLMKVERERSSLLRNLFLVLSVVGGQGSVVTIDSRHSIENQIPGPVTRIAVDAQILVFIQRTTDDGPRTAAFGSKLPFPLSGEILWKLHKDFTLDSETPFE